MRQGIHSTQVLPVAILATLSAWHFYSYIVTDALGGVALHIGAPALAFIMALASLFFRERETEFARYLESIIAPARPQLIGMACLVLGGIHFVTIPAEPIFLKMAFMVLLLAFFETAGMANRFLPAVSGDASEVTKDTIKRLLLNQFGLLAMVFVLSLVLLYISLMVVVGFTGTWTVGLLAAMMIAALAFMAMARNL